MTTDHQDARSRSLGDHCGGRDNNFNLIRFIAASAVLFSHSYALSSGDKRTEPLSQSLGVTFGSMAVDVFFLTSGFLITASLLARSDLWSFVTSRALRIYPGLIVSVSLTVAIVGLGFTSLPLHTFVSSAETWAYLARNTTLVTGIAHTLPGAFESNPWRLAVNASLWTLPYELAMYFLLAAVWFALSSLRMANERWSRYVIGGIALATILLHVSEQSVLPSNAVRLTAMFFTGAAFFVFRQRIVLDRRLFAIFGFAILASGFDRATFSVVYPLALPYVVFCAAYLPAGTLRQFNRLGDYSYGIYVYAWPVQQMIAALVPGIGQPAMLVLSFLMTVLMGVLSWHFVEKVALQLKRPRSAPKAVALQRG